MIPDLDIDQLKEQLAEVYRDRNLLAQLAMLLAYEIDDALDGRSRYGLGGVGLDPDEPDWPVVYVGTPEGQLSYHIPKEELLLDESWFRSRVAWDGHTTEEKQERIRRLLKNGNSLIEERNAR